MSFLTCSAVAPVRPSFPTNLCFTSFINSQLIFRWGARASGGGDDDIQFSSWGGHDDMSFLPIPLWHLFNQVFQPIYVSPIYLILHSFLARALGHLGAGTMTSNFRAGAATMTCNF